MSKSRKTRRQRKTRKIRGGNVNNFQVYVFTKMPLSYEVKEQLLQCLNSMYRNSVKEITDFSSFPNDYLREEIKLFVHAKNSYYPSLEFITGFSISNIPKNLNSGVMNDAKLTRQEYAIDDALKAFQIPLKLVEAPHGMWAEGIAVIALESL